MVIHSCVCHSSCRTGVKRSKRHDSSQVRRSNTICGSAHIHKQEQREASRPIIRRNPVSRSFFCQCESTAVPLRSRASETFLVVDFVKTIQRFRLRLPNCGLGDMIFCATVKLNTTGLAVVVQKKAGAYFTRTPSRSDMTPAIRRRRSLRQTVVQ